MTAIFQEHEASSKVADVYIAAETFGFESYELTESIALPKEYNGLSITWESSDERFLTHDGVVTRPQVDQWVSLTATFTDAEGNSAEKVYQFWVIHEFTDLEVAQMDLDSVFLVGNLKHLKEDLYLPTQSKYGSEIRWSSTDESVITSKGKITRMLSGGGSRDAKLVVYST